MTARFGVWLMIVVLVVGEFGFFNFALPAQTIKDLCGAKLTYGALVAALAVFQYQTWRKLAEFFDEQINNPNWAVFERTVIQWNTRITAGTAAAPTDLLAWNEQVEQRRAYVRQLRLEMRTAIIAHNEAILGSLLVVITLLFTPRKSFHSSTSQGVSNRA